METNYEFGTKDFEEILKRIQQDETSSFQDVNFTENNSSGFGEENNLMNDIEELNKNNIFQDNSFVEESTRNQSSCGCNDNNDINDIGCGDNNGIIDCRKWYERGLRAGLEKGYIKGYECGRQQGRREGFREGYARGIARAQELARASYERGYRQGYNAGYRAGYQKGYQNGCRVGYQRGVRVGFQNGLRQGYENAYREILNCLNNARQRTNNLSNNSCTRNGCWRSVT